MFFCEAFVVVEKAAITNYDGVGWRGKIAWQKEEKKK
jgi:hypothetical protein